MAKYKKYLISEPKKMHFAGHEAGDPFNIYIDKDLVDGAWVWSDITYRTEMPEINPICDMHAHEVVQILYFVSAEGGFEIELRMDDEVYSFNKTTTVWIPPGVKHNVKYNFLNTPVAEVTLAFESVIPL